MSDQQDMGIIVQRLRFTSKSTGSDLLLPDGTRMFTLELPVKDGLPGSAIPPGRFKVTLEPSPKFLGSTDAWVERYARRIPHINGIPNRSHILIHWGNNPDDTDGCLLVGHTHATDFVGASRAAFEDLFKLIEGPAAAGECWIEVHGGIPTQPSAELNLQGDV